MTAGHEQSSGAWRKRLYSSRDLLFASQSIVLRNMDDPEVCARRALLVRKWTKFDEVLEELNNRELLFQERMVARQMLSRDGRSYVHKETLKGHQHQVGLVVLYNSRQRSITYTEPAALGISFGLRRTSLCLTVKLLN